MTTPTQRNITIYQGADFELEHTVRDEDTGLGVDITGGTLRMQVRAPDVAADPAVLALDSSTGPTAAGSTIEAVTPEIIAATAVTTFGADGAVTVTGAGFTEEKQVVVGVDEETGDPIAIATRTVNVAKPGDLVTIAGSSSNDGTYRVASVEDANTIKLLPEPVEEAAAGTLRVDRHGRVLAHVTAAESAAMTWEAGVYDVELELGGEVQRLQQGRAVLYPEATR